MGFKFFSQLLNELFLGKAGISGKLHFDLVMSAVALDKPKVESLHFDGSDAK